MMIWVTLLFCDYKLARSILDVISYSENRYLIMRAYAL